MTYDPMIVAQKAIDSINSTTLNIVDWEKIEEDIALEIKPREFTNHDNWCEVWVYLVGNKGVEPFKIYDTRQGFIYINGLFSSRWDTFNYYFIGKPSSTDHDFIRTDGVFYDCTLTIPITNKDYSNSFPTHDFWKNNFDQDKYIDLCDSFKMELN